MKLLQSSNMKYSIAVCLAVALAVVMAADEKYTTKYDNVNLDEILNNERLFKQYYNCLIDKGSCTPDAAELKSMLLLFIHLILIITTLFIIQLLIISWSFIIA